MLCTLCFRTFEGRDVCPIDGGTLTAVSPVEFAASRYAHQKKRRENMLGRVFGERYRVRARVGEGSMATVYLAEDLKSHDPVALKVLRKASAKERAANERFFRESEMASKVSHPSIISIFGSGHADDGTPYLVMEYLFGETLGESLRRDGPLPAEHALIVIEHAARGLAAAHHAGIVHRDLKPDNIFLQGAVGAPHAVKILDFGLAKLREGGALTAYGTAVGTLTTMAPEQVLVEPIDPRTDVYGLGVVLYRTLTGRLPFEHEDDGELLAHQLLVTPPSVTSLRPDLDPRVGSIVTKMLRKAPDNRYPTMEALLGDLERLRAGAEVALQADAPLEQDPDEFRPKNPFGRQASAFFYKKLGRETPVWT